MVRRSAVATLLALSVIAVGCGSDDDDSDTTSATAAAASEPAATDAATTDAATTEPALTTEVPSTETPPGSPSTEAAAGDGSGPEVSSAVPVTLDEWFVEAPTELAAGEVTFQIQNDGSFPHEFVVIAGEGYESLPLADNGAVLEDELPGGAIVDRTDRIDGGLPGELTVDLPAGSYVLLCNIVVGPTSHAGRGQHLDVTVS
jgi:hypothetical protein